MQTLRWGIIGAGRFGRIHARAIQSLPGSELAALCNRNPERLQAAAGELSVDRCCSDYHDLLDDDDIDVISITTHWQEHFQVALAALASGKHVLLEKPMAATSNQCRQLLAAAERAAGIFMVGHICRFDPRAALAKQAIDAGRIGRIVSMHAKRNLPLAPGNIRLDKISPLMGDGVHDADLMMWFLDRAPTRVDGRTIRFAEYKYPEIGWALLEFADDALGVVETNWGLPENVSTLIDARLEVVGTQGMLTIDAAHSGLLVLDASGGKQVDTGYWPAQHGRLVGALSNELAYFADCVRAGRQPDAIRPSDAARAVAVMEAAEQAAASGRALRFDDDF